MPTVAQDGDDVAAAELRLWDHPPAAGGALSDSTGPILSDGEGDHHSDGHDSNTVAPKDTHPDSRHGRPPTVTRRVNITGRNLFVEGIPSSVGDEQLRALFERFGDIESARVLRHPKSGRPRGVGFVYYETEESAEKALGVINDIANELFGFGMGMSVKPANKEAAFIPEMSNKIFVRNLPFAVTPSRLIEFYSRFGHVVGCSIHKDVSALSRRQPAQMNMGYVTFDGIDEATAALKATHRTQPFTAELAGLDAAHRQLVLEVKAAESLQCRNQRLHHQPTGGEDEEAHHDGEHKPKHQRPKEQPTPPTPTGPPPAACDDKSSHPPHRSQPAIMSQPPATTTTRRLSSIVEGAAILLPPAHPKSSPAHSTSSASSISQGITRAPSSSAGSVPPLMASPFDIALSCPLPPPAAPLPWNPFQMVMPLSPQFVTSAYQPPVSIVMVPPPVPESRPILPPSWTLQPMMPPPPPPPPQPMVWMMPMTY